MALANKVIYQNGAIREFEKPEVCEAIKVANANKWTVGLSPIEWDEREARLKKEYGKNHIKGDFSGNKSIEHCGEPIPGSPALKESASQFNDALLDEQAKKIKRLGKEIARLNGIIHDKNEEIKRKTKGCCELITENVDLKKKLSDKNAILSDVAEELRLSKIREKNLTVLGLKYVEETKELKEQLANKVVDEINANALKSAESALAWKEKVVTYKDMALAYYEKKIAEKDEVIADLGKELAAQKDLVDDISLKYDGAKYNLKLRIEECEELKKLLAVKVGNGIDWKRNADAIKLYVNRASRERLWNPINQDICNEKELSFIINHGGKRVKYALRFDGTDIVYECSDPDKKPRIPTPEISEEEQMKLQEKVCADIAEEGADLTGVIIIKSEK